MDFSVLQAVILHHLSGRRFPRIIRPCKYTAKTTEINNANISSSKSKSSSENKRRELHEEAQEQAAYDDKDFNGQKV